MVLSRKKSDFIKDKIKRSYTHSLKTRELANLADRYNMSFTEGKRIVINGDTVTGQLLINETINILKRIKANTNKLKFDHLFYVIFVAFYWQPIASNKEPLFACLTALMKDIIKNRCLDQIAICKFSVAENQAIQNILEELSYLDPSNNVKPLTEKQFKHLNFILSNYYYDSKRRPQFHHGLLLFCETLISTISILSKANPERICLNRFQAMVEMKSIQNALNPMDVVGYLFTNDERSRYDNNHTEAYIITKNRIIKPLHWPRLEESRTFKIYHFTNIYASDWITGFFISGKSNVSTYKDVIKLLKDNQPQKTGYGCGTFSIIYLKRLLMNDAKQLHEYSLSIPIYSLIFDGKKPSTKARFIFIPPPRVLRYSQSETYNQTLWCLMSGKSMRYSVGAAHDRFFGQYLYLTLSELLADSINSAINCGDKPTAEQNKLLLDSLPAFQRKWLDEYAREELKRARLSDETNINRYLTYESDKAVHEAQDDIGLYYYQELLQLYLPANFKFIQKAIVHLYCEREFIALHYRHRDEVVLGYLHMQVSQMKDNRKTCCFKFFGEQDQIEVADLIEKKIIRPWSRLVFSNEISCINRFLNYKNRHQINFLSAGKQ